MRFYDNDLNILEYQTSMLCELKTGLIKEIRNNPVLLNRH